MQLFNITSLTTTTLVALYKEQNSVKSIHMTNTHASTDVRIELFLEDESANKYYLLRTDIPGLTTLVFDDGITFDNTAFSLKLTTHTSADISSTDPLTVIVK